MAARSLYLSLGLIVKTVSLLEMFHLQLNFWRGAILRVSVCHYVESESNRGCSKVRGGKNGLGF